MVGSTGNYSGASSHPPSLNDTSVSSTSAGKNGWRNTPTQSRHNERQQHHFLSPNQYPNDYYHLERGHHTYPKSTRSMDNPEYTLSRDIAAMSDPGTRYEQNHIHNRSDIEYVRPRSTTQPSPFYESQNQHRFSRQHFQEKRHKETKNEYSPAHMRRKSLSPPLEEQRKEVYSRQTHIRSQNSNISSRDNSFAYRNDGYQDGIYTSSSYNERSLDSSSSLSAVNVKELQRQLWKNNQNSRVASSPQHSSRTLTRSPEP